MTTRLDTTDAPTLDALWGEYASTLTPDTARKYAGALRHLQPVSGASDVDAGTIRRLVEQLKGRRRKQKAIEFTLTALNGFFRWAASRGHVSVNPLAGMNMSDAARGGGGFLGWEEAVSALEDIKGRVGSPRDRALYAAMLYAGVRPKAIGSLRLADLDLPRRKVRVEGRWIDLPTELLDEMRRYLPWRRAMFPDSEWLFPQRDGGPLSMRSVENILPRYGIRIGLRGLRDALATHLLAQGTPLGCVQSLLGYRTAATVAQYAPR